MQFCNSELLEHRSTLLQALEELKYCRVECNNQQKRIETLLADNLQIQQNYEATERKLKATEQKSEKLQNEIVYLSASASEPKLRDEKKKLQEAVEASERTISSLKKEISSLNLSRHQLEIALKQSEQNAIAREKSCGVAKERLKLIERSMEQLSDQLKQTMEAQNILRKNTDAAMDCNREIVRSSAHSNCILKDLRNERNNLRQKLFLLESRLHCQEQAAKEGLEVQILKDEILPLKAELRSSNEMEQRNETEIKHLQEQLLDSQNSLSKATKLLKLKASEEENVIVIKMELEACETDNACLRTEFQELQKNYELERKEGKIKVDEISARSKSMKETLESQVNVLQSQLNDAEDRVGKELDSKYERQRIRSDLENEISEMKQAALKHMDEIIRLQTAKEKTDNSMQEIQQKLDHFKGALVKPVCESKHIQTQNIVSHAEKVSCYSDGGLGTAMYSEVPCTVDSHKPEENEISVTPFVSESIMNSVAEQTESTVATGTCEYNVTQPTSCSHYCKDLPDPKRPIQVELNTATKTPLQLELNTNISDSATPSYMRTLTANTPVVTPSFSGMLSPAPVRAKSALGIINDQVNINSVLERYYASQGSHTVSVEDIPSIMPETDTLDCCNLSDSITEKDHGPDCSAEKSCGVESNIGIDNADQKAIFGIEEEKSEASHTVRLGGTIMGTSICSVSPILVSKPLFTRFRHSSNSTSLTGRQEFDKRLESMQSKSHSFDISECKKQNKRRKLSSTPPMYDASQVSIEGDSPLLRSKPVPLKTVSKQFVKQVRDHKKVSSKLDIRLKPLTLVTVAQSRSVGSDSLTDSDAFESECLINKQKHNRNIPNDTEESEYLSLRRRMSEKFGTGSFSIDNESCKSLATGLSGSFRMSDNDWKTCNSKPVIDEAIQEGITQVDESSDSSPEF